MSGVLGTACLLRYCRAAWIGLAVALAVAALASTQRKRFLPVGLLVFVSRKEFAGPALLVIVVSSLASNAFFFPLTWAVFGSSLRKEGTDPGESVPSLSARDA